VFHREFDDFARQRNFAQHLTDTDWVLSIDADERPTTRMPAEVMRRIEFGRHRAYRVSIHSQIFGRCLRYCGTQDDRPVRLFRRGEARWQGDVHEALVHRGRAGALNHGLEHATIPDARAFLVKMNRYCRLEAQRRLEAGISPHWADRWIRPPREVCRRLFWKLGILDGPAGWAFCALSGLSEFVLADRHRRGWQVASPDFGAPRHFSIIPPHETAVDSPRQLARAAV
jgi:hypothetical protein